MMSFFRRFITVVQLTPVLLWAYGCSAARDEASSREVAAQRWMLDEGGIVRSDTSSKRIALIFTGGEHGEGTEHILDTLGRLGIDASFFVTGDYIAKAEYHPWLRRIVAEGHYLGPHSDAHLLYCAWEDRSRTLITEPNFKQDLAKNIDDLRRFGALAEPGPIYFIPPYEWFNHEQVRWASDLGLVLFNFTPGSGSNRDYIPEGQPRFVSSRQILQDILAYEERDPHGLNGFHLLLHLGAERQDKMFLLLEPLLQELSARGYTFVRIDEMLAE
jgi:peptidoglycan/xylan/chitin deacetylase (PgdA/CDA1 family)